MFIIVSMFASCLGLYLAIGPVCIAIGLIGFVIYVGIEAHKTKSAQIPYWQCVCSIMILIAILPPLGNLPSVSETIFKTILFGIGAFFAYSAIRHGQFLTKIIAAIALMPYLFGTLLIMQIGINSWSEIVRNWTT